MLQIHRPLGCREWRCLVTQWTIDGNRIQRSHNQSELQLPLLLSFSILFCIRFSKNQNFNHFLGGFLRTSNGCSLKIFYSETHRTHAFISGVGANHSRYIVHISSIVRRPQCGISSKRSKIGDRKRRQSRQIVEHRNEAIFTIVFGAHESCKLCTVFTEWQNDCIVLRRSYIEIV